MPSFEMYLSFIFSKIKHCHIYETFKENVKSPGDFASDAWNTEKLISAYDARKKFEMIGAITFNSAAKETWSTLYRHIKHFVTFQNYESFQTFR